MREHVPRRDCGINLPLSFGVRWSRSPSFVFSCRSRLESWISSPGSAARAGARCAGGPGGRPRSRAAAATAAVNAAARRAADAASVGAADATAWTLLDVADPSQGLRLRYSQGDICKRQVDGQMEISSRLISYEARAAALVEVNGALLRGADAR